MFEVHKRHNPMFVTSEVKSLAQVFMQTLQFNQLSLTAAQAEIVPIFQTVRINEKNQFIVKSDSSFENVQLAIRKDPILQSLKETTTDQIPLLTKLLLSMKEQLGVDSYLCIGDENSVGWVREVFEPARNNSKKPVVIFSGLGELPLNAVDSRWMSFDHPTLWLEDALAIDFNDTEAYFSISPTLKMEVSLNRFQTLDSFGQFTLGMVRF